VLTKSPLLLEEMLKIAMLPRTQAGTGWMVSSSMLHKQQLGQRRATAYGLYSCLHAPCWATCTAQAADIHAFNKPAGQLLQACSNCPEQ
jgi:hypothetical protein